MGLPGRVEDVVHAWRIDDASVEAAAAANRAGAFANLAPFCALLALALFLLAHGRVLVVMAATSAALAVVAAAAAAWLDGGLLWSLATALPTPADPGVVLMPAVIEGRPAWAVAILVVGAAVLGALARMQLTKPVPPQHG